MIADSWTHSSIRKPCSSHHNENFFATSLYLRAFYGIASVGLIDSLLLFYVHARQAAEGNRREMI